MRFYNLKTIIMSNFWVRCPFTGEELTPEKFRNGLIHMDHIYSIPRTSKNEFRDENIDAFESIINLRPYRAIEHLNLEQPKKYFSTIKYSTSEFKMICEVLKGVYYKPLKMHNFLGSNLVDNRRKLLQITNYFWKEVKIERPDWFPSK